MNIIFDLDGVLAKYDRLAYKGDDPAYLKPGYYKTLQPDERMVNVVSILAKRYNHDAVDGNHTHVYIKSTSAFTDGYNMLNQYRDKKSWLTKYCYGIDPETDFMLLPKLLDRNESNENKESDENKSNKHNLARLIAELMLFRTAPAGNTTPMLTYRDILIDDYNENLENWREMGGLAIKYNNGINSPNVLEPNESFNGIHISQNMISNDIVELLSTFDLYHHNI